MADQANMPERTDAAPFAGGVLRRPVFLCLLLAVVTLAVYWPVRQFEFITYDDPDYYTANRHVREGLSLDGLNWALTAGHASNWHPVTWLSHMLDASLFGPEAAGPHIVNLLLHTANTLLLFLLLLRLTGFRPAAGASTPQAAHWCSALVAALFALHPLHVESVAWISERKDVLSTFFGLLALSAYARHVEKLETRNPQLEGHPLPTVSSPPSPIGNRQSPIGNPLVWSLVFFALSLMSKPMLVTLPFVLLLLDYWPLQRVSGAGCQVSGGVWGLGFGVWKTLLREKLPFFALAAVSCVLTVWAQSTGNALTSLSARHRIETALVSYARYLGKAIWPADLAIPYPYPEHWPVALVAFAVALLAGASLAAVWLRRRAPFVLTGWLWYLGTLVPVIGLVQVGVQSMADRYTYVPLIGIFVIVAWGAGAVSSRGGSRGWLVRILAVLALGACAVQTRIQLGHWRNTETLFRHAVAVTTDNFVALNNLGHCQLGQGRIEEAMANFRAALRISPKDPSILYNLGGAFARNGQFADAIPFYEAALQAWPDHAGIHNDLGVALNETGRRDEAIRHYREALRLDPDGLQVRNNLANALVALGRLDEAMLLYQEALRLDPTLLEAWNNLGWVLAGRGQLAEAVRCYQSALQLKPDDELIHKNLADALAGLGRKDEAIAHYDEALRIKPDYPEARQALQAQQAKPQAPTTNHPGASREATGQ